MSTSLKVFRLLEYKDFYNDRKSLNDAIKLIEDIPSVTLLNYISGFMIHSYLHDNDKKTGKIQFELVSSLLNKCSLSARQLWVETISRFRQTQFDPIFAWSLSNLHFYDIIFTNFNNLNSRDLTSSEAQKVFDAYLIINQQVNLQIDIKEDVHFSNKSNNQINDFIVSKLMYQRDYMSSLDFRNQVQRGEAFFNYLESHSNYSQYMSDYFYGKGITNSEEMFRTLLVLFTKSFGNGVNENRKQLIDVSEFSKNNYININYLNSLCINQSISDYKSNISFLSLRNQFLYRVSESKFLLLNINFLLDHFFNSQVFAFHQYLKDNTNKSDFLSIKAKEFMEEIYLPEVFQKCFPNDINFFGDELLASDHTELCDGYVRRGNKIFLMEFKDVLLNARIKNSTDINEIKTALDLKFKSNQKGKPKGIMQLANAINTINQHKVEVDIDFISKNNVEVFPIIVYTDNSFGQEGLNAIYCKQLNEQLVNLKLNSLRVRDLVFINLNFFEMRSHYFYNNSLDFFDILDKYLEHIKSDETKLTSFEVFARHYTNENNIIDLPEPDVLSKYILK